MTRRQGRFLLTLAMFASIALPAHAAEDGPLRHFMKERRLQREQLPAAAAATAARIERPGDYTFTMRHAGSTRLYRVHVPKTYDPATPAALLLALHGGGGSMEYQSDDAYYGLITAAEQQGFVAVFPNGFSRFPNGKLATWNAGSCCGGARDSDSDDVGFIRSLIARLTRQLNVDRARIFAAGMSNGGMMAYRLACEMSDVFTAIAAVAGTDNTRECTPRHPVAVLHIHARNDSHVLYTGGPGPDVSAKEQATDFTSVPDSVARWVRFNGCAATPQRIIERPGAYCDLYSACREDARVQLCVTETGGHSWPGGAKPRGGEPPSQALSANAVMWDFFTHR